MISAITTGYRKGIATIIDANVITLLTAFVLFGLATGGVKGFAFTLGVGVLVSLFTAVVFTRAVLGTLGRSQAAQRSPLRSAPGEQRVRWHFDFVGASKWFFSISGVILRDRRDLVCDRAAQLRHRLRVRHPDQGGAGRADASVERGARLRSAGRRRRARGGQDPGGHRGARVSATTSSRSRARSTRDQVGAVQRPTRAGLRAADGREDTAGAGGFDRPSVGPTFGAQVARSAAYAIIFSLILISAYMAFRFEAKYAIPVMIAVIHDILITAGVYSLSGREVSSATVAAFLTILGYSLYDTVIVFDRIRENVPRLPRATFAQIANRSLSEVLTRSLITGLSTVFLITVILIFGGETLGDFAFAMMVGVALRNLLVDLHRDAGADRLEGARVGLPGPRRADQGDDGPGAALPRGQRGRPSRGRGRRRARIWARLERRRRARAPTSRCRCRRSTPTSPATASSRSPSPSPSPSLTRTSVPRSWPSGNASARFARAARLADRPASAGTEGRVRR